MFLDGLLSGISVSNYRRSQQATFEGGWLRGGYVKTAEKNSDIQNTSQTQASILADIRGYCDNGTKSVYFRRHAQISMNVEIKQTESTERLLDAVDWDGTGKDQRASIINIVLPPIL